MYIHICIWTSNYTPVYLYVYICVHTYVYVYMYIYIYTYTYAYMFIPIYGYMYICSHVSMYRCMCVHMYMCILVCMSVCMCVYMSIYLSLSICVSSINVFMHLRLRAIASNTKEFQSDAGLKYHHCFNINVPIGKTSIPGKVLVLPKNASKASTRALTVA